MSYLSVVEIAKQWGMSERSVRNYCAQGRVEGAFLTGKTWNIPSDAEKPYRIHKQSESQTALLDQLKREKKNRFSGSIYHKLQVDLTYHSNCMEGNKLTYEQTRSIFETNTLGITDQAVNVDDVVETINHFECVDMVINEARFLLTEKFIKQLHRTLKSGTSDSRKVWFAVGEYKLLANEVDGHETTPPEKVAGEMKALLKDYNKKKEKTLEDILEFYAKFEQIYPFQNGNGPVGRLIIVKECLRNNIEPDILKGGTFK
ncbi:MAG: Fic family protein [Eubacterium sp.]|nr:Fic family protein [Eubacterium sp.]